MSLGGRDVTAEGRFSKDTNKQKTLVLIKNINNKFMKYKALRMLAAFRKYANTEKGERVIVRTLTAVSVILIIDVVLLVVGSINQ